jgi:hypothetical protein
MTVSVRQSGIIRMPFPENPIKHDGPTKIEAMSMPRQVSAAAAVSSSPRLGFQSVDEGLKSRRHLAPAWIVEKKTNRARHPVLQQRD